MAKKTIIARYASGSSKCNICKELIASKDIEITHFERPDLSRYHFLCGEPKIGYYFGLDNFINQLTGKEKILLQQGIFEGNSRFTIKHVSTTSSKNKRAWIEIFKFAPPTEVLQIYTLVCKEFYHISGDEELGKFHCISRFNIIEDVPNGRNYYITLALCACIGCNEIVYWEIPKKCPILNERLCRKCRVDSPTYKKLNKRAIIDLFNLNPNVLNLQGFKDGNSGVAYNFMVENAVFEFRKRNKDKILQQYGNGFLRNELEALLDALDVKKMIIEKVPQILVRNANLDMKRFKTIYKFIMDGKGGCKRIVKSIH